MKMGRYGKPRWAPVTGRNGTFFYLSLALGAWLILGMLALVAVPSAMAQTVDPNSIDFGNQNAGTTSGAKTVTFTNDGSTESALRVTASLSGSDFAITSNGCNNTEVRIEGSCKVEVVFKPGSAGKKTGAVSFSYTPIPVAVRSQTPVQAAAAAPVVTLTGTGVAIQSSESQISGVVFLDDAPASGFTVILESQPGSQTTGADGRYTFKGLSEGFYRVRVINYDPAKVQPIGQDYSNQTVTGTSVENGINFRFKSVATPTTVPPTTVPPTTPAGGGGSFNPQITVAPRSGPAGTPLTISGTGWNPKGPDGGQNQVTVTLASPTSGSSAGSLSSFSLRSNASAAAPLATLGTFPVAADGTVSGQAALPFLAPQPVQVFALDRNQQQAQAPFKIEATVSPECPNVASGQGLRIATKAVQINSTSYYLCIQAVAGQDGVNLNDTIILELPNGATASEPKAGLGTVNIAGNVVRWGGFSLAARQSTTLVLTINAPGGTLNGTSIFVSGRFNRGQSFQQRIPGLPPLTEIDVDQPVAAVTPRPVPRAAPATGTGESGGDDSGLFPLLAGVLLAWLATLGFFAGRRYLAARRR